MLLCVSTVSLSVRFVRKRSGASRAGGCHGGCALRMVGSYLSVLLVGLCFPPFRTCLPAISQHFSLSSSRHFTTSFFPPFLANRNSIKLQTPPNQNQNHNTNPISNQYPIHRNDPTSDYSRQEASPKINRNSILERPTTLSAV
jgi:hypothetical protein